MAATDDDASAADLSDEEGTQRVELFSIVEALEQRLSDYTQARGQRVQM